MAEKLGFPPYQGLPFDYRAPDIDGFAEWEIGVPDPLIESGWVGCTRLTYAGASGVPVVSFQALKDSNSNDFIYLSFVVRFDLQFNDKDAIILVLQPNFNTAEHGVGTRRILIRPNIEPIGAGAGDNPQNLNPDKILTVPGKDGGTVSIPIRTNRKAVTIFSKFVAGVGGNPASWEDVVVPIQNVEIKARSWDLGDGDRDWSVEIKLPATVAKGGTDWITLNPAGFGLYFNVLRFSTAPATLTFAVLTEFSWPRGHVISDNDPDGPYQSLNDIMIPAARMGQGILGAGTGVYFDGGWNSIGVLSGGVVTGTIDATLNTVNTLVAKLKNDSTTDDALRVNATFRLADFGIGPNPNANGSWGKIDPAASATPGPNNKNPTDRVTVLKNNGTTQLQMDWKIDQGVRDKYEFHGGDQCLLVELDSDQNAAFRESSYRRNLAFANLSEVKREVVVSGEDYGPSPAGETDHEFLLVTSHRFLSSTLAYDGWMPKKQQPDDNPDVRLKGRIRETREGSHGQWGQTATSLAGAIFERWGSSNEPMSTWVSVTSAFRRTGQTLTLGDTSYSIFEEADSYSHVLSHEGPVKRWEYSLTGDALTPIASDGKINLVRVPVDGKTVLKVKYEAVTEDGFWHRWPWWVWLLILLIIVLIAIII
ncbi:hypothetical protein Nit79A3_1019 [Nitrosomonas sp. Is79A3]|uniref:hypothetical protein n=1 Tax=Nitrosomonas sp. (strain Is79A3) TaxID=261292 RepID=UPI000215C74C